MKYYILFFLTVATFNFAQEFKDAEIELVHIKSKPKIVTILKRVNKQLLKKNRYHKFCFRFASNKFKKFALITL
jgi:hypothetical protein